MAQKDSVGTYVCVARNKLGTAKNEVHLEIKGKAEVMKLFFQVLCDLEQILQFGQWITLTLSFKFQIRQGLLNNQNMQWCKEGAQCPLNAK